VREESIGWDQLATLDSLVGVRDGLVKLSQFVSRDFDVVLVQAVDQALDQLDTLVSR
jgi:hypothetical protein